jgi:dehydrogenase/reductase SDR family member 12
MNSIIERLLDRSILFSYDKSGYRRHAARWSKADDDERSLKGRVVLVTGANSGIGKEAARSFAARGAETWLLCRSERRGEAARREIQETTGSETVFLATIDLSDMKSVRRFAETFDGSRVDVLVHNAGVLPDKEVLTADGLELTLATNLVGPFLLSWLLREKLQRSEEGRIIHVTSGGMYSKKLSVDRLVTTLMKQSAASSGKARESRFDGVAAYALTKRAMVVLTEQLAEQLSGTSVTVHATHPGWADTPAVRSSLPRFWRVTRSILRSPAEGADTIVWLAASEHARERSGRLWFDREPQKTHLVPWTREKAEERARLWRQLCEWAGVEAKADWRMG